MKGIKITETRFGLVKRGKKRYTLLYILLFIIAIGVALTVAVIVQNTIHSSLNQLEVNNDLNSTWLGAVASYWGGVIGGVISGSFTVIGVILTIVYYKKADNKKDRLNDMPFIEATILSSKHINSANIDISKAILLSEFNDKKHNEKDELMYFKIALNNIGKGFAHTLSIISGETLGGNAYTKLIRVNEQTEIEVKAYIDDIHNDRASFSLIYIDCMTNEYMQTFTIRRNKNYSVESGYPSFLGQAHEIGKD